MGLKSIGLNKRIKFFSKNSLSFRMRYEEESCFEIFQSLKKSSFQNDNWYRNYQIVGF